MALKFVANAVPQWLAKIGAMTRAPGSHCENGDCWSFNGLMRGRLSNGEIVYTGAEA